jgi:hypothetical protein
LLKKLRLTCKLVSCLFVAVVMGCAEKGPELTEVTGRVLLDGKPLTTGSVVTLPTQGRGARGTIDAQGNFTLNTSDKGVGASPGKHQVAVIAMELADNPSPEAPRRSLIPQKYSSAETSGLFIEVTPGEMEPITLELSSQ